MIVKTADNIAFLYPGVKMDIIMTTDFEREIMRIIKEYPGHHLVINFRQTESVSSSSLRVMVTSARRLKELGHKLVICEINEVVERVFNIVNLIKMLKVFKTEKDAVEYLNPLDG